MAYASRLYPRAKPRGFTLQWIKNARKLHHDLSGNLKSSQNYG